MGLVSSCWSCLPFLSAFVLFPFVALVYLCLNTFCVAASAEWLESQRWCGFCLIFACKAWAPGIKCICGCRTIWLMQFGHVSAFSPQLLTPLRSPAVPPGHFRSGIRATDNVLLFFFFPNCISAEGSHTLRGTTGERPGRAWQSSCSFRVGLS